MDFQAIWVAIEPCFSTIMEAVNAIVIFILAFAGKRIIKSWFKANGDMATRIEKSVINAVNNKVVPDTIRLDISSAVNRETKRVVENLEAKQALIDKKTDAMMKILTNLTAFKNLPESDKNNIVGLIDVKASTVEDLKITLKEDTTKNLVAEDENDEVEQIIM